MAEENSPKKSSSWPSRLLRYGLPLAISIGLCWVLFHNMDFAQMWEFVKRDCDFTLIFVSMAFGVLAFFIRAERWRIQLRAANVEVPLMPVTYSIVGTYAVNLVLPRFGELWRCEYIARRQKQPFATVLGSMVAERLADTATVATLLLVTFIVAGGYLISYFDANGAAYEGLMAKLSSPLTYVILIAVIAALWGVWRIIRHKSWAQKIVKQVRNVADGFTAIFHMKGAAWWLFLTIALWGTYLFQMYLSFEAFGMTSALMSDYGFVVVLVVFVAGSISMGVPSNGGIGPYQFALVAGLKCFDAGLDEQSGYAFANVVLGSMTLVTIVCGLISFALIALDNRRRANLT